MSHRNPLTRDEVEYLEKFRLDIPSVKTICSTRRLTTNSRLCQKYFADTQDRKYKELEHACEERHDFVAYAKSKDAHEYVNSQLTYIYNQYDTILDNREDNTHKIMEALNNLHKLIKKETIQNIIEINKVDKKNSQIHISKTLLTYNTNLISHIRKSQDKLVTKTANKEDGYTKDKYIKQLYKVIDHITIYPITHEELKEKQLIDTERNYSLGTLHKSYLNITRETPKEDILSILFTLTRSENNLTQ